MNCVACARELPEGAAFCPGCGAKQTLPSCATCGAELTQGAAFCFKCGAAVERALVGVAVAAERRMTSVLFADLVSYTTLSESQDTEDVRELLTEYFDVCSTVVRRYGGTVEKFIGDAVMAVWGVPTAHEDDAERAVRAALELVAAVQALGERLGVSELALRAGVVTGEVAATVGATDQGMVAGDPVNTAARIQAIAQPGQVWVDANTRALTAAAVTYVDMGEHPLKGKAEPVHLFRAGAVVASIGGSQRVDGLEAPLIGRDREMRLLKELFHATEDSGRPRLVVFDGEAGVGKSRLGWELEKYIDGLSREVAWHRGRCLSYGDGVAFWALAEAVRARVGVVEEDSGVAVSHGLDRLLDGLVTDPDERAWLRPRVASLLGEDSREFEREDLFAAWTRLFERVGGEDPIVLMIDDAQHADQGLLDFLEHLIATSRAAMFVLLLARPELLESHPQLGGRRASVIRLEPLGDAAMGELVNALVEGLSEAVAKGLVERSEGIPLFAVETVRALIDRELVQPSGGRYVVAPGRNVDLDAIGAPASLHALVAARLDALSTDERRVVTDASVLGESFTREGIGILSGETDSLDAVLSSLQRKEILATDSDRFSAERGQFRFVQSVVKQVAYSTLSRRDRKLRHLAVADHLANQVERLDELALVIAQHLLDAVEASGADDPDIEGLKQRASDLFVVAADRACALGGYADGIRLYRVALEHTDAAELHAPVQEKAAAAAVSLGLLHDAIGFASSAMALFDKLGDPVSAGRVAAVYARASQASGDAGTAVRVARERYDALDGVPDSAQARARLASALTRSLQALGEHDEAVVMQAQSLRLAEELGEPMELANAMQTLAVQQLARGSSRVGGGVLRELIALCRENEYWAQLVGALSNLAILTTPISLASAVEITRESLATAREHGLGGNAAAWANLGTLLWSAGDWPELAEMLDQAKEVDESFDPGTLTILRVVEIWREDAGLEPIEIHRPEAEADDLNWRAWHELELGLDAARRGDPTNASAHAQAAVDRIVEDAELSDDFVNIWPSAVRLTLEAEDLATAASLIEVVASAPPGLLTVPLRANLMILRALAAIRSDDEPDAMEADLRAGIAALDGYGAIPMRARAQEDLGSWLLAQGRTVEAQPVLDAARAAYRQLGAMAWLERLDASHSVRTT